ncbi:MAG: N-acetylmuramoyl-L-alanine amidase, partial [Tannerellaceae bacterium]|nr:N-acetylmuramoyl-L-alanine amidase [Tannerellaceae bacterium]
MRTIDTLIIHCSASAYGQDLGAAEIDYMHRHHNGWKAIGYHYIIRLDGQIEKGRPDDVIGAHTAGRNTRSLGICYIGGLDRNGQAADTRTPAQTEALIQLVRELCEKYPVKSIIGHRDTSPDLNGNGIIDPWERIKECPCFDVIPALQSGAPTRGRQAPAGGPRSRGPP